jgi:hypothetical protein
VLVLRVRANPIHSSRNSEDESRRRKWQDSECVPDPHELRDGTLLGYFAISCTTRNGPFIPKSLPCGRCDEQSVAIAGFFMFAIAQQAHAQGSEHIFPKTLMKNWALPLPGRCTQMSPADANATASAYLEFGRQRLEAYEALNVLVDKFATKIRRFCALRVQYNEVHRSVPQQGTRRPDQQIFGNR